MSAKTSIRRLREVSLVKYVLNGTMFVFFGKKRKWAEHRKDFKAGAK
jgi:hypothetical protein